MRGTIILAGESQRSWARKVITDAPQYSVVTIKSPTRSTKANARMWALLTDLSTQVLWHGIKLSADDWKDLATAAMRKARMVPGLDGAGLVALGLRTSQMTVEEMNDLQMVIEEFGNKNGVVWSGHEMPP